MTEYGTKVKNPVRRGGGTGYKTCTHCKKWFTALGISRHWDRCPKKPQQTERPQA